jgi:hypothetical protein
MDRAPSNMDIPDWYISHQNAKHIPIDTIMYAWKSSLEGPVAVLPY